ncbi:hypothetical protein ABMA27_014491 [Loxostege sticticalis]|uniref:Integrase catalytic domain-containing protein n=1 Tax=Loxostege sticticalis TaxID=481309 RepID=A0ABR3I965_LOXSC
MDFSTKIEIAKLKGKENWATWKYNVSALLEGAEDALEAVNGTLVKPTPVTGEAGAGDAAVSAYKAALAKYKRTESSARLMLTTNMSEETLKKVMRYTTAHEVWKELHRLFDGESQNVIYSLCLEFFGLKHSKEDDIPTHMSKIKNLWNEINVEILKIDPSAKLPEVLLVCKVLDTLDDRYFNFKSSWLMLKQTEKTIDSLTSHLCDFERNLGSQGSTPEEALVTMPKGRQVKHNKDEQLTCNYCSGKGHRVRKCKKWIRDGRPPKTNQNTASGSKSNQVLQMTVMDAFSVNCCSIGQDQDRDVWYVDNGATTHIATRRDFFTEFHEFDSGQTVLTADGTPIHALGQGTVVVESNVNGNKGMITLHEVWLVPSLKKNLFSTLAAQDRVTNSIFISTARECRLEVAGTTKVVGRRTAGHVVKTLLTDNGGEFANEAVLGILQCRGIKHRMTMPYTPEQNGCSERENRTLVEAARSIMYARGEMPNVLWAELINTAAYVLNRTGPTRVDDKSPYELWRGKKPKISHLKIIGSECYVHVPKQLRKKMGKKAIKGTLIGYEDDDGYRIWSGAKMLKSRDITFNTNNELRFSTKIPILLEGVESNNDNTSVFEQETEPMPELDNNDEHVLEGDRAESQDQVHPNVAESQDQVHPNVDIEDIDRTESQDQVHFETEDTREIFVDADGEMLEVVEPLQEVEPRYNLRDRSGIRPPKKLEDYVCFVGNESFPETFKEAIQRDDSVEWQKAMANEMKSLADNKVWKLCELPPNRKALPCKWVYRIKRNPDGTIDKYKARLVVKGFRQRKGIDYEQTFSPVARMATIRALLSVSAKENLYLTQFDVSTAFLNGKLQEEIYMNQPDGYNDGTSRVCLLQRSLYGLKQAPRCWNSCFEEILLEKGFVQCAADSCLFTKKVGDKKILITLYVDDGLVATTDKDLAEQFLEDLRSSLKITSKPASYYLGLEIARREDGSILIKQESYTKKILERFGMSQCNPVSTPIEKGSTGLTSEEERASERFPYREAVGALAYLMTGTRPDIAYAVGIVSRKLENPTKADWLQVKRIFRYLKGTTSLGIEYKPSLTSSKVIGYSDADHGGCADTGRSTTGVVTYFCGGAISWLSKRQQSVSISTTEAEIVAASEGARELVWLQRIFRQLTDVEEVPILLVDNEAAIRLAHNPEFHKRTKHIRIRHFFVRETVQEGLVDVKKTSSMDQLADIFTKAVPKPCLQRIRDKLGLRLIDVGKC